MGFWVCASRAGRSFGEWEKTHSIFPPLFWELMRKHHGRENRGFEGEQQNEKNDENITGNLHQTRVGFG